MSGSPIRSSLLAGLMVTHYGTARNRSTAVFFAVDVSSWDPAVSTEAQVHELASIPYVDFFTGPSMHSNSEVMACAEAKETTLRVLAAHKIQPKILVDDMAVMGRSREYFGDIPLGTMDWNDYHGLENIYAWLDDVVKKHPTLISMEVIGKTYENREIRAYKIEKKGGSSYLIHAREWTISLACPYIINELTEHTHKYYRLLREIRFYIVPVVNPDGFVYTNGTGKDLWQKNRRPIPGNEQVTCPGNPSLENIGVNLNRNWPFKWVDDKKSPCLRTYPGVEGIVEAELKAVTAFILKHDDIDTFIDIQAFSQFMIIPWGYTKDPTPDHKNLILLAKAAADAAETVNGTKFQHGQVSISLLTSLLRGTNFSPAASGPSNGGSMDWAYGAAKKSFTFALLMRPTRAVALDPPYIFPFRVPINEILPVAIETWNAVQVLASKRRLDYSSILNVGAMPKTSATLLLSALLTLCHIGYYCLKALLQNFSPENLIAVLYS